MKRHEKAPVAARACVTAVVLLWAAHTSVFAAEKASPTPASGAAGWKVEPDPLPKEFAWPETVKISCPIPGRGEEVLCPTSASPFAAVGFEFSDSGSVEVWNLITGKKAGAIQGKPATAYKRALSHDGKYLAVQVLDAKSPNRVEVWSFATGKLLQTITAGTPEMHIHKVDFGGTDQLFCYSMGKVGGSYVQRVALWDIPSGKKLREVDLPSSSIDDSRMTFSPGRRYIASLVSGNDLVILDLTNLTVAGKIVLPKASEAEPHLRAEALRFTPNGNHIAVLLDGTSETRIALVDIKTGAIDPELNCIFPGRLMAVGVIDGAPSYKGPTLECLTNGGFLIAGTVFVDGDTGRVVWYLDSGEDKYNHAARLPVPNGVIVREGPENLRRLTVVEIPWKQVTESLKAIDEKKTALVAPGTPVSLEIVVGKLQYGTPDETKKSLAEAMTERLAAEGIEIKDSQPIVLKVGYAEAAGATLQESTRDLKNPLKQTPTGRSVQTTQAGVSLAWMKSTVTAPVWTKNLIVDPQFLILNGDVTPEKARGAMFEGLKNTLLAQPIPYFIPKDKSDKTLVQLPGFSQMKGLTLTAADRSRLRQEATKKRKKK